jgi:hypothetical protein
MSTYSPDRWIVVKIIDEKNGDFYKVFGTWSGGYLDGDSWKLSSGFDKTQKIEDGQRFISISNFSGSIYNVGKHPASYDATSYGRSVLNGLVEKAESAGFKIIPLKREEAFELLGIVA